MEAVEHNDVCEGITMSGSHSGDTLPSTNSEEEHSKRNRKNVLSMPASVSNGRSEALIHEKGKRCVSEFPQSKEVKGQKITTNTVSEISENSGSSDIAICSLDEIGSGGKISDNREELIEQVTHLKQEAIFTTDKAENESSSKVEEPCHDATTQKKYDNSTSSDVTKAPEKATSTPDVDISKDDTKVDGTSKPSIDSKEAFEVDSVNNDVILSQKSQNLTFTTEEIKPNEKSSDSNEIKENGSSTEDHHQKKNLSFEENQDPDPEMLRKKDPTKENATKVFRESYFMKTKGKIYYKKKGPFSKWRSQFVILDDNKQQMCFFKSLEEYEKLARCKNTVDLRFITEIKHQKQKIFQSNFPFKVYRRAGLSTVKLAADSEEERARWITTIQEIIERIKATPERDLDANQRSSTLPCIKKKKSADDVSTDSETCTTSSAPEQDDLIRPKKVSKTGFKINSNQISSIKLKRTSSQMRETRESKLPEEEEEEVDTNPQEKFGVSLRRVNTEKPKTSRDDREKSPDYVEFKQKYNSLNTSRKNKTPNIPLNANSIVKTALIDNVEQEDRGIVYPSQILKDNKDLSRKRSPSPNIPISKGVEAVMKNADEESVMETTSAQNSLNVSQIRHATLAEVPQHESVIEDLKISEILTDTQNEKQTNVAGQTNALSIPTIQLTQLDSYEAETSEEQPNYRAAEVVSESNEIISNETAVVIDVNEPSNSSSEPNRESTTLTIVHPPEEPTDPNTDPLKINAIKKFIQEMKSDASDADSRDNLNVTVVDSSVENSPAIYPRKTSKEMKSEDSLSNIRLSTFSYGSQLSTESEEPLPRLNFLGKTDRSSTGSSVLKETMSPDEPKSEKTSDSEAVSDLSGIIRMKPTESTELGGRSSLIAPEFTVVEENPEEIMSTAITNTLFEGNVEETVENQRPSQIVKDEIADAAEVVNNELAVESQAEVKILDHPKSEVTTEINFDSDFQNELSENSNIALLDSIKKEHTIQLKIVPQEELQTMPLKTEDIVVAVVTSDNEADNSKKEEKKYCNKMEMTLSTKTTDNVKVKANFCKQISASSLHSEEAPSVNKTPEMKSTPLVENIPQIMTENDSSTADSDGEIEILETQETSDYFPSYGGADVEYRIKEDYLNIEQTDSIRTSGIAGLKEFLKDNEDSSTSPTEIKSAISRLGTSPAIEKLKIELPKQQLQ